MTEEYWITQNGHRIAVGDMSLVHLRNTLRLLLRAQRLEQEKSDKPTAPRVQKLEYMGSPKEARQRAEKEYKGY